MRVKFFNRDFTEKAIQPAADFDIRRYMWDMNGGPAQADVDASGDRAVLFELVNHLREPIEILNDRGDAVWWGFLESVDIQWMNIRFGADLDTMFNNVAVAYTNGPQRFTTQWSGDADSIAEYGYKEMLLSHSDCTDADALSERDTYLARRKTPVPVMGITDGREKKGQASLRLSGWYSTLEWQYYLNLNGFEGYEVTGDGGREIGEDDRPIFAQAFQLGSGAGWTATSLWLRVWRQGPNTPGDNLEVSIRAESGGIPTTILATASMVGSTVPTNAAWTEFALSTGVALSTSTTYFIYINRSGAIDPDAYYMVDTNMANGYPRGAPIFFNTNEYAWVSAAYKGDLLFRLTGDTATTTQIQSLVVDAGQFFSGSIIENASGVDTIAYRDGDSDGLYELEKLLGIGTSNDRRLLAEVTRNRYLRVYEEPVKPAMNAAYGLGADGTLYFPGTRDPVNGELCTVGVWCTPIDIIPATVDLSLVGDVSLFLIEAAEYSGGEYKITRTRDQSDPYQVGGIEQG